MLEFFGDALGAILSGGATGLLGTAVSIWGEVKKNQINFEHQQAMKKLDQESMRLEAQMTLERIKTESEAQQAIAEVQAMANSYAHDKASYYSGPLGAIGRGMMVFVDFLRGLIRPVMTVYLVVLTTLIYAEVSALVEGVKGSLNIDQAVGLMQQIILVILYLTSTVVLWWFGTRQKIIKGA